VAVSRSRGGSGTAFAVIGAALAAFTCAGVAVTAQSRRDFDVSARKYSYRISGASAPEIRVQKNDLVHITFAAEDIPHSFTIDDPYRIMRRAEPGHPVSFDFRADTPGTFDIYCNLSIDERCSRELRGRLIVQEK
jgi:heme/copper-type cytochrome/quinol oxidase subunit 2